MRVWLCGIGAGVRLPPWWWRQPEAAQLQRGVIKSFRQPGDARKTIGGKQPKAAQPIAATQESVNAAKGVEQ